jgi:hypothetical protein
VRGKKWIQLTDPKEGDEILVMEMVERSACEGVDGEDLPTKGGESRVGKGIRTVYPRSSNHGVLLRLLDPNC